MTVQKALKSETEKSLESLTTVPLNYSETYWKLFITLNVVTP